MAAIDSFLSRWLLWALLAFCIVAFGLLATIYFGICWVIIGVIDAALLRKEREATLRLAGVPEDEIDGQLLPRDRMMRIARSALSVTAAAAFHFFA